MAIDSYAPCPGGTGKKIKFCCSELVGDLEQLDRLVEGDQISAALDQVKRLAEKHPGKACLLATQTKLELASKQFTEAAGTARPLFHAQCGQCNNRTVQQGHRATTRRRPKQTRLCACIHARHHVHPHRQAYEHALARTNAHQHTHTHHTLTTTRTRT